MERVPNTTVYNIFLTFILAFATLWFLYITTPNVNYNVYHVKNNKKN